MIFRKRRRRGGAPPHVEADSPGPSPCAEFYPIEFDMMVKGAVIKRRGGVICQFAVTVGGSTRLVTSGDTVDRETYEALLAAGAILAASPPVRKEKRPAQHDGGLATEQAEG